MNIYLHQDDKQTGPFTEEQIRQMLQTAVIRNDTLAWSEGMAAWQPVSSLGLSVPVAAPVVPPPPPVPPVPAPYRPPAAPAPSFQSAPAAPAPKASPLGLISFIISLVSLVGWVILLVVAGLATNAGTATKEFNIVVGLFVLGGLGLNFMAMVLGIIGAFKGRANTLAILGACLNGFIMVGLIILVIIGTMMRSGQQ